MQKKLLVFSLLVLCIFTIAIMSGCGQQAAKEGVNMDVLRTGETVHAPVGEGVINRILPIGKALVFEVLCEGQLYYYSETELAQIKQ